MLIAEMLKWFDVIAIQECRENFGHLDKLQKLLGAPWRLLFSDVAGNDERMAFVYDSGKLTLLEKIGEIAFPVAQLKSVKLPGIKAGFDRNPYLATFSAGPHKLSFLFPQHSSEMGSNLAGDAHYDQIAFFPGETQTHFTGNHGVFDFDAVVFPDLWNGGQDKKKFNTYVRYYLSDHLLRSNRRGRGRARAAKSQSTVRRSASIRCY